MYIALDDTDSKDGMCTTFLATELIKEFHEYKLLSYPKLVRLNPNIPWKTRGNGAVVIEIGKGLEKKEVVGSIDEDIGIWSGDPDIKGRILERSKKIIKKWAEMEKEGTDPGLIVGNVRPPRKLYEKGVSELLDLKYVKSIINELDLDNWYAGNGRGLIGAASALAWIPEDHTYELIAYRDPTLWGKERLIDNEEVKTLDAATEKTFDTYDHAEKKQAVAPNSPCPVLYGIRGEQTSELHLALDTIKNEKPNRWLTFLTNQGTDDHIKNLSIQGLEPYLSAHIIGVVSSPPYVIPGGHVFFEVSEDDSKVTAAAYEPTKGFRDTIKKLVVGDKIELWGGIREKPITLNIEKMKVNGLENIFVKKGNPVCPHCGKSMSSMGKDAGYRCKRCRSKADEEEARVEILDRDIKEGWYEVPVVARRHLSKPLKRIL